MRDEDLTAELLHWYSEHARDLPWRAFDVTPWAVMVSEFMLQQTPVVRVVPVWSSWMHRWPTPASLAGAPPGDAIRAWGRLGYPRRAMRLHAAAVAIVDKHAGRVPSSYDDLRALPGVGDYTAAAIAAFGFGAATAVLDTNVRRVYARLFDGAADASRSVSSAERLAARSRLPETNPAGYSVAVMELGALICTARNPACDGCPVRDSCRWLAAGRPPAETRRRTQPYAGTDRQVRGRLLAALRDAEGPVPGRALDATWPDATQRKRALVSLLADGLVEKAAGRTYRLPG